MYTRHKTNSYLEKIYNHYRRRYFKNLPDAVIYVTKIEGAMARTAVCSVKRVGSKSPACDVRVIEFDKGFMRSTRKDGAHRRMTMLHEMAHISCGARGHGRKFQAEMQRLAMTGAFKDLW